VRDAQADAPAVHLEFRLARAARTNTAAQTRERVARSDKVCRSVAQLRELDLQLTFTRPRMTRKYVKDEDRAICYGDAIQHLF